MFHWKNSKSHHSWWVYSLTFLLLHLPNGSLCVFLWHKIERKELIMYSSRSCELYPIGTYLTMPSSVELSKKQRSFSNLPFSFIDDVLFSSLLLFSESWIMTFEMSYSMILILHTKRERAKNSAEVETNQDIQKHQLLFSRKKLRIQTEILNLRILKWFKSILCKCSILFEL